MSAVREVQSVFVVTMRRSESAEPESYYIPAPDALTAETRARSIGKMADGILLSIASDAPALIESEADEKSAAQCAVGRALRPAPF